MVALINCACVQSEGSSSRCSLCCLASSSRAAGAEVQIPSRGRSVLQRKLTLLSQFPQRRKVSHPFRLEDPPRAPSTPCLRGKLLSGRSHSKWGEFVVVYGYERWLSHRAQVSIQSGGILPWTIRLFPEAPSELYVNVMRAVKFMNVYRSPPIIANEWVELSS